MGTQNKFINTVFANTSLMFTSWKKRLKDTGNERMMRHRPKIFSFNNTPCPKKIAVARQRARNLPPHKTKKNSKSFTAPQPGESNFRENEQTKK